jgi:hypothetical protein
MRKLVIYGLAIVGAVRLLDIGRQAMPRWVPDPGVRVELQDESKRPIRSASVFIDLGRGAIDRVAVDSNGVARLSVSPRERRMMRMLLCAPGFQPMAWGSFGDDVVVYRIGLLRENKLGSRFVRGYGWYGPMPRECPQPADSVGWYAAVPGVADRVIVFAEPDWSQQPTKPRP